MNKDQFFAALAASLNHKDNRPTISDTVEIDDGFITVNVVVEMPKDTPIVVIPTYFAKELVKKIPALRDVNVDTCDDGTQFVTAQMEVGMLDANAEPANTADSISALRDMGGLIIQLIITNSNIPKKIDAIAKDCACWTFDGKNHGEGLQEGK